MYLPTTKNVFSSWQTMFIKIYLPLLAVFGFSGNLMVSVVYSSHKIHQTSMNTLIVNLTIADMLQCINLLFTITAINDITWFNVNTLCQLNGMANLVFTGASLLSLMLISINRYFVIVKKPARSFFTRQNKWFFLSLLGFIHWCFHLVL